MIKPIFLNNYNFCGINSDNTTTEDKASEGDNKPFKANYVRNNDYEGYVSFRTDLNNDKNLVAHYDILDPDEPPTLERGRLFDAEFVLTYLNQLNKVDKNSKTTLKQEHKTPLSTETDVVAQVVEKKPNGTYKINIDDFPKSISLVTDDNEEFNVGDKVRAFGMLDCEFKE